MFISDANAADTAPTSATTAATTAPAVTNPAALGEPSPFLSMVPMLFIALVIYFLILRPQQRKIKEHDSLVKSLKRGDKIVTAGGVIGTIQKLEDEVLVVEIAPEVKVRVMRDTIAHVMSKLPVANDNKSEEAKAK